MFTRLKDDPCAYKDSITQSTSVLNYIIDLNKYSNCNPCRIKQGIVGGNNVSLYQGNMVDLESDMLGLTRKKSKCPSMLYKRGTVIQNKDKDNCSNNCPYKDNGIPCPGYCKKNIMHLPECNMFEYRPRINNTGLKVDARTCPPISPVLPVKAAPKPKIEKYWQGQMGINQSFY
jgi:hypothetical protein